MENKTWLSVYTDNYNGKSVESKSIEEFIKKNFKNDPYLPWATMERLAIMQDPECVIEIVENEKGGFVHVQAETITTVNKGDTIISQHIANFVKLKITFMGRTFVETYPIQNEKYEAPKYFDQNMVNKALQRAKARLVARATGLGLKLYEGKDLQFEEDVKPETPPAPNTAKKTATQRTVDAIKVVNEAANKVVDVAAASDPLPESLNSEVQEMEVEHVEAEPTDTVEAVIQLIRNCADPDKLSGALRIFNPAFLRTYKFAVQPDKDSDDVLRDKLRKLPDIDKFHAGLKNRI